MKKLLLTMIILILTAGVSLFSWETGDLLKYPSCTKAGDKIINFGIGFYYPGTLGADYIYIPPLRLSFDYNIPIGEKKLPFFAGGIFGYSGYGYKGDRYTKEWFYSTFTIGGRFGYHFNWNVDKLDTYAVVSAGWIIYAGDGIPSMYNLGWPFYGISIGARYFVTPNFGFWAEAGYTSFSLLDIGLTFKF